MFQSLGFSITWQGLSIVLFSPSLFNKTVSRVCLKAPKLKILLSKFFLIPLFSIRKKPPDHRVFKFLD